jgi:plasmid stability protein
MATLTIRNVEDWIIVNLKNRAQRLNRSFEAELREALQRAARDEHLDFLAEAQRISAMTPANRRQTDSVKIIHEMRAERDEQLYGRRKRRH